jgi:nitroreductase
MLRQDAFKSIAAGTSPLMQLFAARRSVRKYDTGRASAEQITYIEAVVARFRQRCALDAARIVVVDQETEFTAIVKAAMGGVVGKVNPWLLSTKARQLLLCGAIYADDDERVVRERALKQAAMAMQIAILAATEVGLATCWMAGINHRRIELSYPMPDAARLVAISALGIKPARSGLSWDAAVYNVLSKRRRPLEAIWLSERWQEQP